MNNGICYNTADYTGYTCECSEEYTGKTCDVYRACFYLNDTCLNDGTCYYDDTTDETYLPEYTDRNVTDWLCSCAGYFTGKSCETAYDACTGELEFGGFAENDVSQSSKLFSSSDAIVTSGRDLIVRRV